MHSTHPDRKPPLRRVSRAIRLGLVALVSLVGAGLGASACLDRPLCDTDCTPRTTNVFVDTINQTAVNKIDLLFMIDNSSSMSDKQIVLAAAVPELVERLVNPNCLNADGGASPLPLRVRRRTARPESRASLRRSATFTSASSPRASAATARRRARATTTTARS